MSLRPREEQGRLSLRERRPNTEVVFSSVLIVVTSNDDVGEEFVVSIADQSVALGPTSAGTLMVPDEFDAAVVWDPSYAYELVNGVLAVNPPPHAAKRGPNELLGNLLHYTTSLLPGFELPLAALLAKADRYECA